MYTIARTLGSASIAALSLHAAAVAQALTVAGPSSNQDQAKSAPDAAATGTQASSVPGGPGSDTGPATTDASVAQSSASPAGGGDIIVTARRRAERLQDVPLTVQAFSETTLARRGITRTDDLGQTTPSLSIQPGSQGRTDIPTFEIRGISSGEATIAQDTAVALYFDEVYQARPAGVNQQLYDLDNVQVLSGPQGTLFGRNSTAGAILFTSKRPTDKFEGEVSFTGGNYDRREFRGIINVPITDDLKIRISGQRLLRDGYTKDIAQGFYQDNVDAYTGRASVLWNPGGGRFTNVTIADYYHSQNNGGNDVLYAVRVCQPAAGVPAPFNTLAGSPPLGCLYGPVGNAILGTPSIYAALAAQQALGVRTVSSDARTTARTVAFGISNITTFKLNDQFTLKNIFGHRYTNSSALEDLDDTPVNVATSRVFQKASSYSDELQLQGSVLDDHLNVVAGLFYFRENGEEYTNASTLSAVNPTGVPAIIDANGTNTSKSIYGQATYKLPFLEALSLTVGGRYTWDQRRFMQLPDSLVGTTPVCYYTNDAGVPLNPCGRNLYTTSSEPTYTFAVDYKLSRNVLLYATTRRGYRAGGFTFRATSDAQTAPFKPEIVKDVEAGIKADWNLGNGVRLRTNLDGYHIDYSDVQETVVSRTPNGSLATLIVNAAKARINGAEANVNLSPVTGFDLGGYLGYVDGKFQTFNTVVNGQNATLTNIPFPVSKYSYGVTMSMTPIDRPSVGTVTLTANWAFRSTFYGPNSLPDIEPESRVPGQGLLNLTLDWAKIGGSRISGQVFVRNALNEKYVNGVLSLQDALGLTTRTYGEPLMAGATIKYNF